MTRIRTAQHRAPEQTAPLPQLNRRSWWWSRTRLGARRGHELARAATGGIRALTGHSQPPATQQFTAHRVGDTWIRPTCPADGPRWQAAMAANEARMSPWWDVAGSWAQHCDHIAFADHVLTWRRRARAGTGLALAVCPPTGLAGELLVWNIDRGAGTAELGLWARPGAIGPRQFIGCLGAAVDFLFGPCGLSRLDAPVETGNAQPRKVLALTNFSYEGTLRQWRLVRGRRVDLDMFGLTPDRWELGRRRAYRYGRWEPLARPVPGAS